MSMPLYRELTAEESAALVAAILKHADIINKELSSVGLNVLNVNVPELVAVKGALKN